LAAARNRQHKTFLRIRVRKDSQLLAA